MEPLESVVRLSRSVLRVLGQGTNTYLIGVTPPYILFDTGDGIDAYLPQLDTALKAASRDGNREPTRAPHVHPLVSDIIISHRHHDHHGGLPSVLSLLYELGTSESLPERNEKQGVVHKYIPPRIHKLPNPTAGRPALFSVEKEGASFESTLDAISQLPLTHFESSSDKNVSPRPIVHDLVDGQSIRTESPSPTELRVIHTPGHTTDSISLILPDEKALFTADTVLGEGTAIFEDLAAYMSSLHRLVDEGRSLVSLASDSENSEASSKLRIYPGHGPVHEDGLKALETYITHRADREDQILSLLRSGVPSISAAGVSDGTSDSSSGTTIRSIVRTIYANYPPAVWPAAERGVWLHIAKLESEGRVARVGEGDSSAQSDEGLTPEDVFAHLVNTPWVSAPEKPTLDSSSVTTP